MREDAMRIQNAIKLTLIAAILLAATGAAWSREKGNEAKGRFYFKQTCKSCHTKGAVGGEITPMSKTQAQWARYFATGKHSKGKELLSKILTEEQLRDIETFLFNHAVDSPQPETCGK